MPHIIVLVNDGLNVERFLLNLVGECVLYFFLRREHAGTEDAQPFRLLDQPELNRKPVKALQALPILFVLDSFEQLVDGGASRSVLNTLLTCKSYCDTVEKDA